MEVDYYSKYLKYKSKYLTLKTQLGGDPYTCDTKNTEANCNNINKCKWNTETGKCNIRYCGEFEDITKCNTDICYKNEEKNICRPKSCNTIKKKLCNIYSDCTVQYDGACGNKKCEDYDYHSQSCPSNCVRMYYGYNKKNIYCMTEEEYKTDNSPTKQIFK
jgi:hypothetical protein